MKNNNRVVRLTESKLKQMIAEAVQETLNEYGETEHGQFMLGRLARMKGQLGDEESIYSYAQKKRGNGMDDDAFQRGFNMQHDYMKNVEDADETGESDDEGSVGHSRIMGSLDRMRNAGKEYYDRTPWRQKELEKLKQQERRRKFSTNRWG